jgi:hypothetical protein
MLTCIGPAVYRVEAAEQVRPIGTLPMKSSKMALSSFSLRAAFKRSL